MEDGSIVPRTAGKLQVKSSAPCWRTCFCTRRPIEPRSVRSAIDWEVLAEVANVARPAWLSSAGSWPANSMAQKLVEAPDQV